MEPIALDPLASSNADPDELRKFGDLAHRWWDTTGEFAPLHAINPLRLDWIADRATLSGARIVDIGCGGGILAESLAARGADVTGIDLSEKPLAVASLHGLESGVAVRYERIAAEDLAAREPAAYDIVTCMEMLEHVPDPASVVRACATLVRPGGHVFFSTINRNPKAYLFAVLGAEYLLRLLPRGTHDYQRFVTPAELIRHARAAGLSLEAMIGLHYNPLTRRYWLAPNVDVNYMISTTLAA
jgi:2-polyprenyl-6-hydroxyphenyl methylase/3-demethylubiquinone-9 3-methyltransferase